MVKKTVMRKRIDPKVRSFFILAFPTIVIILIAMLFTVDVKVAVVIIALAIYHFLMLKQFIDQYHEVL